MILPAKVIGCRLTQETRVETACMTWRAISGRPWTRVWDMTYVDEGTRVVRAARTMEGLQGAGARGRAAVAGDDDDCVFVFARA